MVEESKIQSRNLLEIFTSFTNNTRDMDGRQFAKLCKDTKLLDAHFTSTSVDLLFAKIKDKAARKINFA